MSMSDNFPPVDFTGALENLARNLADPARRAMMELDVAYEVDRQGGPDGLLIAGFPDRALVGRCERFPGGLRRRAAGRRHDGIPAGEEMTRCG